MFYRPGEVARELGVSYQTILLWEKKGLIPKAKRVNNRRLFTREQLEDIKTAVEKG